MAFQHTVVMLGQLVMIVSLLVPLMGGGEEEKAKIILISLFISGWTTLMQCLLGTLLPSVMASSSYAYFIPSMAIAERFAHEDPSKRFSQTMRTLQGALMMASLFQLVIASLGVAQFGRRLSPLTTTPLVILSGFGFFSSGFPQIPLCSEVSFPALMILVFISIILPYIYYNRSTDIQRWSPASVTKFKRLSLIWRRFGLLASLGWCWLLAYILSIRHAYHHRAPLAQSYCRTERYGLLRSAPGIWFPLPLQWGTPIVDFRDIFPMLAAALVSTIECSSGFIASSRLSGLTHIPPFVLRRGAIFQSIGSFSGSMFGTVTGITTSIESVGLVGLTRVATRDVTPVTALVMIFCSLVGKIGTFLASIPFPIVSAWYCIFCCYIVSSGFNFLQYCNLNNRRHMTVLGCSTVMGVIVPLYCRLLPPSSAVSDIVLVFGTSAPTIGVLTALLLDLVMPREESDDLGLDSGMQWFICFWDPNDQTAIYYSVRFYLRHLFERVSVSFRGLF
ncbi:putative xanthine/uracil/vitamin C permease [Rosa chinensis]|uniref:Putative xanthine/uracil/vitamin C permease n=1 Tax=Rosa chinensis TaxID=74649 RepID=A0A2P6PW73_ROSCH|nr:putative xanthine/uracil/vitamin C permease [Rosa chinensis]